MTPVTPITKEELRSIVIAALVQIAPDADIATLDEAADLRDALDIDSMDFLRLVAALHERLGIDIPERDYAKVRSLSDCVDYLALHKKED